MVTQNMLRMHEGKLFFSQNITRFVTAFDLVKCLKQIKSQRLLPTFAPISEVPSNISTTACQVGFSTPGKFQVVSPLLKAKLRGLD